MAISNYLDFDLQITRHQNESGGDGYRARVLSSPVGQATSDFLMPFSDIEIYNFHEQILEGDNLQSNLFESRVLKETGQLLFDAIFTGPLLACLGRSLDEASEQKAGLRLKLRLNEVPELISMPWEYLYYTEFNRFLALSIQTPLIHFLELPSPIRPLAVDPPLRILAAFAEPTDQEPLDADKEWANLQSALADLIDRKLVEVDRLDSVTVSSLQRQLRRKEYHIFHFVGHGIFDYQSQNGTLAFVNDDTGYTQLVSAQHLGRLLHNESSLRLAVLNACEGAQTGMDNPFTGVAQTLVQQGVPAVIAMQLAISDQAAIKFSHEFYAALADGYAVDTALTEARVAISTQQRSGEWGTPRLFMHASNGLLWKINPQQVDGAVLNEGFSALASLMRLPEVKSTVIRFRTAFHAASDQIDVLADYKDLHDLLHNLEFLCYKGIVQEARRFADDEMALTILSDHELTLQGILLQLSEVTARKSIPTDESRWIEELVKAQAHLQAALEEFDEKPLNRAIRLLKRVLYRQPSRVNERLNASARALRLAAIEQAMILIRDQSQRFNFAPEKLQQFESGVDALSTLHRNLNHLVEEHDQWQAIDLELRRLESVIGHDLSELEWSWPDLKEMAEPLYVDGQESWVTALNRESLNLDKALDTQNPVRIKLYFQRFRRHAGNRFYQVDTDLKNLCDELRKVGEPLSYTLKMLA